VARRMALSDAIDWWAPPTARALGRVALSTLLLVVLGAAGGAVATVLAFWAAGITGSPTQLLPFTSLADARFLLPVLLIVGAMVGAAFAPVAGWLFLRRVTLWRAVVEPAAATVLAAGAGGWIGIGVAIMCALGAFWVAAARLGWTHRRAALGAGGWSPSSGSGTPSLGSGAAWPSVG